MPYTHKKDTHIAGVTFCNSVSDGGENRQDLLKALTGRPTAVKLSKSLFKNENGTTELAIKVISRENNKMLGYIPKDDIPRFAHTPLMILQVSYYKGKYAGALHIPVAPSSKQYGIIKTKLWKGDIKKLPTYDKAVYSWVIENY